MVVFDSNYRGACNAVLFTDIHPRSLGLWIKITVLRSIPRCLTGCVIWILRERRSRILFHNTYIKTDLVIGALLDYKSVM